VALEAIRRDEMDDNLNELRRIGHTGTLHSHRVSFRDFINRNLDALTVPDGVWESRFMAKAGYYTNRILRTELIKRFDRAGFAVESVKEDRVWPSLPTPKSRMVPPFSEMSDEELMISGVEILAVQR
jgi:hypothetical protein